MGARRLLFLLLPASLLFLLLFGQWQGCVGGGISARGGDRIRIVAGSGGVLRAGSGRVLRGRGGGRCLGAGLRGGRGGWSLLGKSSRRKNGHAQKSEALDRCHGCVLEDSARGRRYRWGNGGAKHAGSRLFHRRRAAVPCAKIGTYLLDTRLNTKWRLSDYDHP